jgi:acetyl-CoA acetyltransferase
LWVIGVGLHPYQKPSDTPYSQLGVTAVRKALADAGLDWSQVQTAYTGTATTSMALSRLMYRHLGATGIPMLQVENASASGSTAFRQACIDVAAGIHDLVGNRVLPVTHFALLASRYMHATGASAEQIAAVAVKNSRNAALNPYAQRPKARSLEEVLAPPKISGMFTRLQCCPIGEGAAAAIVVSESALDSLGLNRDRAVRVRSSVLRSETYYGTANFDAALTAETTAMALEQAGVTASEVDVVELHDAFTVEELLYVEAMGLCEPGQAASALAAGEFDIGGRVAVNTSGGLLSMGHPIGPTGVGQIAELTTQLRAEAGPRQHPDARVGLAHMVGLGAVCAVHVLSRD